STAEIGCLTSRAPLKRSACCSLVWFRTSSVGNFVGVCGSKYPRWTIRRSRSVFVTHIHADTSGALRGRMRFRQLWICLLGFESMPPSCRGIANQFGSGCFDESGIVYALQVFSRRILQIDVVHRQRNLQCLELRQAALCLDHMLFDVM